MAFSTSIFGEKSKEVINDEDSYRKLNLKNASINKSALSNKLNNSKNEEFELEIFNDKNISNDLTE